MTPLTNDAQAASAIRELRDCRRSEPDWGGMEERLVQAFTAQHRVAPVSTNQQQRRLGATPYWAAAAAAAVVLAAAITFYPPAARRGTVAPAPPSPPAAPKQPPAAITDPTLPPAAPAAPVAPTRPRKRTTRSVARLDAERQRAATPLDARGETSETRFDGFVTLPGAFSLPDLESGRIVRVEVPLTMLPAYGIAMVPDATPEAVQADFLIGQDGMPRAIRLASSSQR